MGLLDDYDTYYGPYSPAAPANAYAVQADASSDGRTLSPGRDRVLPSHEFWDRYVSTSPAVHDQIGRLQSAGLSAVNSLGFGLPMALAHRLAPETARDVQAVIDAYPNEKTVANVGGAIANPANVGLRAAGNALASRGYSVGAQAAADGATALGAYSLAPAIQTGGLPMGADIPATTAMTARFMMPSLPASLTERVLRGAQAGALAQVPGAALTGDVSRPVMGAVGGAGHGASLRMSAREPRMSRADQRSIREGYFDGLGNYVGAPAGVSALWQFLSRPQPQQPYEADPNLPHLSAGLLD